MHTARPAPLQATSLCDADDADADAILAIVSKWTAFFREYRAPRPSGAGGVLTAGSLIHVRRPSSRSLEAAVHVTPDDSAPVRGLAALVNPTQRALRQAVRLPLYYSGLPPGTSVTLTDLGLGQQLGQQRGQQRGQQLGRRRALSQPFLPIASGCEGDGALCANATFVLGEGAGAGFTDVVLTVELPAASYVALAISV